MYIEFDVNKNDTNIRERGLSLQQASDFDFENAIIKRDSRKPYPELRYVAVGFLDARLHVLRFTPVEVGIRVICFRKANSREVKHHEQTHSSH